MTGPMSTLFMVSILLVFGGFIIKDAWEDRTPRKPFDWHRPDLEWWAHRQTKREVKRGRMRL